MLEIALAGEPLKTCAIRLRLRILQANQLVGGLQTMLRKN